MEFILASTNAHKAEELNDLLSAAGIKIIPAPEKLEVEETGTTFQENAYIKAKAYYDKFGKPVISDDSGLVVPSMPDILGIYSARFAPDKPEYSDKIQVLIDMMKDKSGEERAAYFVCYLCCIIDDQETFYFEGRVHGVIGQAAQGDGGFGYDPIFYPEGQGGKALAEVGEWKMKNSHRAKASQAAVNFYKGKNSIAKA